VKYSVGEDVVTFNALTQAMKEEQLNLPITKGQVNAWQDPMTIIGLTKSQGGSSGKPMKKSMKLITKKLKSHQSWLLQKQKQKTMAQTALADQINVFIKKEVV